MLEYLGPVVVGLVGSSADIFYLQLLVVFLCWHLVSGIGVNVGLGDAV